MDLFVQFVGALILAWLSFTTNRMIKGIDTRFDRQDKAFWAFKSQVTNKLDKLSKEMNDLERRTSDSKNEIVQKTIDYATSINKRIHDIQGHHSSERQTSENIKSNILRMNHSVKLNQNSIAMQKKKLNLLIRKLQIK